MEPKSDSDTAKMMAYDAAKRSAIIAYFGWFFLGWFAFHRFYAGKTETAMLWIFLEVFAFLLIFGFASSVGWAIFLLVSVWWLIDIFLIPSMVEEYNKEIAAKVMAK